MRFDELNTKSGGGSNYPPVKTASPDYSPLEDYMIINEFGEEIPIGTVLNSEPKMTIIGIVPPGPKNPPDILTNKGSLGIPNNFKLRVVKRPDPFRNMKQGELNLQRQPTQLTLPGFEKSRESVFDKFDKLSLQEKLNILEKSKLFDKVTIKNKSIDPLSEQEQIKSKLLSGFYKSIDTDRKEKDRLKKKFFKSKGPLITIWDNNPFPVTGSFTNKDLKDAGFKRFSKGWKVFKSDFDDFVNKNTKLVLDDVEVVRELHKFFKLPLKEQRQITSELKSNSLRELANYLTSNFKAKPNRNIRESVPSNDKVELINKLLADKFPANDIKKQMDAFFAIPDPEMLDDFRSRRAEGGDDECLRPILRNYVKKQLDPLLVKMVNLNESKTLSEYDDLEAEKSKIQDVIQQLNIEDEKDRAIIDQIWRILNSDHIQSVIGSVVARPIADETAMNKLEATQVLTKVIYQVEDSYDKIKEFLDTLEETGSAYDVDNIKNKIGNIRNAFVSEVGYSVFKTLLPYGSGANKKGPGEFALAMLSDRVRLSEGGGDLIIDEELVELKLSKSEKNSAGGRLGTNGISKQDALRYIQQYRDILPTVMNHIDNPDNKSLGFPNFIKYLNADIPVGDKRRYDIAKGFYSQFFDDQTSDAISRSIMNNSKDYDIINDYYIANFNFYKAKANFQHLLAIDIYTGKTIFIDDVADLVQFRSRGLIGAPSLSFIPTDAGPTEVFVQMSFTKKSIE